MAPLKPLKRERLSGSTVIEVIVASVLFLIVLFLAMEMLVRIGSRQPDNVLLQVEIDRKICVQEFRTGVFEPGEYTREYTWGEIAIVIKPYRDLTDVRQAQFVTRIEKSGQRFNYRILKPIEP